MIVSAIATVLTLIALWMMYKKMGHQGWEGIVPVYNVYVLCKDLYGSGWKMLLLLIPLYNIYFLIKMYVDLAKGFHKGAGFAIGMLILPFIFMLILGLGKDQYGDGRVANNESDFVSGVVDLTKDKAKELASLRKDDNAIEKLAQLNDLKEKGIISDEEYEAKRAELMSRI